MIEQLIADFAQRLSLPMTGEQGAMLARYHTMIVQSNASLNLTRFTESLSETVARHYINSIAPLVYGWPEGINTIADMGTGAGFPGIPLSIMLPHTRVVMFDSLGKRVQFVRSVIDALGLNAEVHQARAEDVGRDPRYRDHFDLVTARAVANMTLLSEYLLPLVRCDGWMLALKGPAVEEELAEADYALEQLGGKTEYILDAPVPGMDWEPRLVYIRKTVPTPPQYPRRSGMPKKRPLVRK
ncbi:MAG: 16S rRNA (guanine(527)-N(7))-methyltransferase RsmG [Christensenellales bacterium]|nr:16S rRNA (guanine(527)-N(7))-methyltransferase RsmG [Christensenellales bacterium]